MTVWKIAGGYEVAHAYDSDHALFPVCGVAQGSPVLAKTTVASVARPCRRCLMVLGSRRARLGGDPGVAPCVCLSGDHCVHTGGAARCPCEVYSPRPSPRTYLYRQDERVHAGVAVW